MEKNPTRQRFFFEVAYDGTNFHGWQKQRNATTVQGEIEKVLARLFALPEGITGSGRTDTGVHCHQQFFHADLDIQTDVGQLAFKMNCMLPPGIAIRHIFPVINSAHARFDAIDRTYKYRIIREKDPFLFQKTLWMHRPINLEDMNAACEVLKRHTDFEAFSRIKTDVNHFHCTIIEAEWVESAEGYDFRITANRFLRGMVRALVGTFLEIGEGKRTLQSLEKTILAKDRKLAGPAVAPGGLYLYRVRYPDQLRIT